jgi:hypothetical protein
LTLSLGFGSNFDLLLLNLFANDVAGAQSLLLFGVASALNRCLRLRCRNIGSLLGSGLGLGEVSIGLSHLGLCCVLTRDSESFLLTDVNTLISFGSLASLLSLSKVLCNLDLSCPVCLNGTNCTISFYIYYIDSNILNYN